MLTFTFVLSSFGLEILERSGLTVCPESDSTTLGLSRIRQCICAGLTYTRRRQSRPPSRGHSPASGRCNRKVSASSVQGWFRWQMTGGKWRLYVLSALYGQGSAIIALSSLLVGFSYNCSQLSSVRCQAIAALSSLVAGAEVAKNSC